MKKTQSFCRLRPIIAAHALINADLGNHISIPALARKTGTNSCYLKRGFKSLYRVTIYQYLLQARMARAVELLQDPSLKHTDIAFACGYDSLAGFITAYRKFYGMAPGQYRKQLPAAPQLSST